MNGRVEMFSFLPLPENQEIVPVLFLNISEFINIA
jgi:hypothetical protein